MQHALTLHFSHRPRASLRDAMELLVRSGAITLRRLRIEHLRVCVCDVHEAGVYLRPGDAIVTRAEGLG
ncbi:hypothetical protein NQ160_05395 [Microbacterium sp. zg.Y909]|nr:hypothetical protein [Microbacterium sp. zg.Y909]